MQNTEECHACLLPTKNEKKITKLIRQGNTVYKFTIKNGMQMKRFIEQYGETTVQQKLQRIMLFILEMGEEGPAEVYCSTSLFPVKISVYPWPLCKKIYLKNSLDGTKYIAAKQQFAILITSKDSTNSGHDYDDPNEQVSADVDCLQLKTKDPKNREIPSEITESRLPITKRDSILNECSYQELRNRMQPEQFTSNTMPNTSIGIHKDCVTEKRVVKEEEKRLSKLLNTKGLDAQKLTKKCLNIPEGFFTKLFSFHLKRLQSSLQDLYQTEEYA